MKKKVVLIVVIISFITLGFSLYFNTIKINEYSNNNFKINYDSTWKILEKENSLKLEHKRSKSVFEIQCKELDRNYIDTELKDLIDDIIDSVEKQNEGYNLINSNSNISDSYDSFSYLYEKDDEQALVNVYKKDNKLIIIYYIANSKYYDIVLDSVDSILESLEIISGETLT